MKLMNRDYDAQEAVEAIEAIRAEGTAMKTMSHFIVGFPSETESEFQDTIEVMKKLRLDNYGAFIYSDMEKAL